MKSIRFFIAVAYTLSIALSLLIGLSGGHNSPIVGLSYASMFLPALAVVIVKTVRNEPLHVDWNRFPLKYLPAALFLLPVAMHAAMLPATMLLEGPIRWQTRGWGAPHIVGNAIFGIVFVSFLALFEEIGWRAWLLPRLIPRFGARRAVAITAIVWGIWHVPYALSGIQHIDGVSPLRLALSLPFGIMATGLVIGWLWLRTESIWIASIAHGAVNNWGQYAFKFIADSGDPSKDLMVLWIGGLAVLVVGICLLWLAAPPESDAIRT